MGVRSLRYSIFNSVLSTQIFPSLALSKLLVPPNISFLTSSMAQLAPINAFATFTNTIYETWYQGCRTMSRYLVVEFLHG